MHRLATAKKEVEEVEEEVQEINMNGKIRKMKRMEVSRSKRNAHHMRGCDDMRNTLEPCGAM